ncbi:modification methylase [Catenulispora sp. GAS73]
MHRSTVWETALTIQPALPFSELDPLTADLPLSVWVTGQQDSRTQRRGRYIPASMAHPGKMLPAIARHAIEHYTKPDDLVIDPMCGIGTTLVEAIHLGRDAIGVEYEQRWANLALANIDHAADQGATGGATAIRGDARHIDELVSKDVLGRASLVLTSPPYGDSLHGQVRTTRDSGRPNVEKYDNHYSRDPGNLAHRSLEELMEGFTEILTGCRKLLKPGGFLAMTVRPIRRCGVLVDIPTLALAAAADAGFTPWERCVALLVRIGENALTARASFFQQVNTANARKNGQPLHLPAHEDALILRSMPLA